jgi:hypothetical protein
MVKLLSCLFLVGICLFSGVELTAVPLFLKDKLHKANPGDFIVTARNKNFTLWHVYDRTPEELLIEEITVPAKNISLNDQSWRDWVGNGAYGNTAWIVYTINLNNGSIQNIYSYTHQSWMTLAQGENLLSILLNLPFQLVPERERRKIGSRHHVRTLWQPPLIVDGQIIPGAPFDSWRTVWPKDGSDLSGKTIEMYLPQDDSIYPAYLPYWLEVSGMVGKAKVRIVDSGKNLSSPRKPPLIGKSQNDRNDLKDQKDLNDQKS